MKESQERDAGNAAERYVSEREAVLRERAAYVAGIARVAYVMVKGDLLPGENVLRIEGKSADTLAAKAYPLPKVTRPRTFTWRRTEFRIRDGALIWRPAKTSENLGNYEGRSIENGWCTGPLLRIAEDYHISEQSIVLRGIVALFDNPTEEVEAE